MGVVGNMSVIGFRTRVQRDFFGVWIDEVKNKVAELCDNCENVYFVFSGYENCYVYFPDVALDGALLGLPDDIDPLSTPVYCNPEVDMSLTSIAEITDNNYDAPYASCSIEDVTISDVLGQEQQQPPGSVIERYDHPDSEIRYMCMFVNLAQGDPSVLLSYIKYAIVSRGYPDTMIHDVLPVKYTMLEARSEMRKCNPELYTTYKHRLLDMMLESVEESRSKSEMEHKVSGLAFEILFDSVVNCMNTTWCFADGVWKECPSDGYIWNFLTSEFIEYLTSKGADRVATHLMSVNIRSRMMKDIKLRLQDDHFYERLDSKKDLIRMTNGVYNTRNMTLSCPVPNDYVSVIAGVPYQIFDKDSHEMSKLIYILRTIFPDPDILDFFILSCSTFLEGYNSPKVFYIWWGMGNNAKSLVQTLVMKTFGEYCSTAPTSLVTGKRTESSNATPELCHVEKRLVVFLQEPNPEEKIKVGKMKEMTGNDSMYVRQLFKSGKTMTLKAKIVIVCNNIIEIPGMDAAIRRRIVVIPFASTFLDPAEYNSRREKGTLEPNTNIIDLSVEKELMSCKYAFMYLLCRRYSQWINEEGMSMDIPDVIKGLTEEYITRNNHQLRFIRKFLHHVTGSFVPATEIYEMFKEWFKRSYPSYKVQDFEKFTREMTNEGYQDDGNGMIQDVFFSYNGEHIN